MSRVSCAILIRRSGQVMQRAHVVKTIRELDENHADVVDHREQHLAEVLGLPLLARRERNRADLGHAFDDMRDFGPEELVDPLDVGERVFDDIVEEAGRDRDDVELEVGQEIGDLERMHHIGLARMAHLPLVLEGREDIGPPQQLEVRLRAVGSDFLEEGLEPNHWVRCLRLVRLRF